MHPRNKLRLMAGVPIDPALETTELAEAREVPHRSAVKPADEANLSKKSQSIAKACQHLKNAVKALEAAPATDTSAEIPQMIEEIEKLCTELEGMNSKPIKESESFNAPGQPTTSQQFKDGDIVLYDDGIHVVVLSDSKADMVGIIPAGMANASAEEKNRSVEMVKPEKLRKPTDEELAVMKQSPEQRASIDDDMAAQFSMESVAEMEANLREWDMKKAAQGGRKYKKEQNKKYDMKPVSMKKKAVKEEECEMTESTLNYKGHQISHDTAESDPINVVGQGEKQWANSLDPKMVKDEKPTGTEDRGDQSMTDHETKVKFPPKLRSEMQNAINTFRSEADKQGSGHTAQENAQLYADTADAFEKLLGHLNAGTLHELKQAQIFAQTLMGPMLHKLPDGVWDFITNGGQKRSLKDYMFDVSK